jgi:hypothetical protein
MPFLGIGVVFTCLFDAGFGLGVFLAWAVTHEREQYGALFCMVSYMEGTDVSYCSTEVCNM